MVYGKRDIASAFRERGKEIQQQKMCVCFCSVFRYLRLVKVGLVNGKDDWSKCDFIHRAEC